MDRQHWYLHADLDAFFASVEQLDHPEYRGKPVIVGGLPSDLRSVVSTASYEARKFGVHSAMPTKEAFRLCPQGIYLRGNHHRYEELSWQIMQIFSRFSPDIQQMSIDEAFIDLTGTERLFGPPEETAMKIKKAVKEETGLTVSIGLAQTKYFAKLSSDINKPDGFYFMKPGTETDFMLSLPIEKIWGIGKKTSARIKESGLKTTRQIYETPLPTLTFLYGENTANFLYNILRGKCDDMFGTEAKSHSLSNERTFPVDVSDPYACETALMELAHSVMFRLLRDNLHSRTVVIKIRYDDFTTVSARQTYETEIITLDSFFEKVRDLFSNKYDRTKGVRLLGVGFDNVHKEETTYQQELFDDGQKKKQAVEKAILNIEKKFPDIQVHKARIIKPGHKALAGFLLSASLFTFSTTSLRAEEKSLVDSPDYFTPPLLYESPSQLFDITKDDSKLEFLSSGFWKTEIIDNSIFSFGKDNAGFSAGVPVFKQEVDLSFLLTYNKQWFFETNFADEFRKNTITFGFKDGNTVKKALLSNRNIIYPSTYSSSVFNVNPTGGANQSPGFSMNLQGDKWKADFLLRYDMLSRREQVFYGNNQVSDLNISPSSYIHGRFFELPEGYTDKIKSIYVEDKNGTYRSREGRRFKKLDESKYLVSLNKNMIFLAKGAASYSDPEKKPYILISFENKSVTEKLFTDLGSFSETGTFLGDLQKSFSGEKEIKLANFCPDLSTELEGEKVLILQTKRKFSPFEAAAFFTFPSEASSDYQVISLSSELELPDLKLSETEDFELFSKNDFFADKNTYIKLYNKDSSTDINWRFPLSQTDPEIYLFDEAETDTSILIRSYVPVQDFSIPTTASGGSVTVTINGLPDPSATFNQDTGIVSISKAVSQTDRIVISWSEEESNLLSGALTGAAGFSTSLTPNLSMDFDITSTLPVLKSSKNEDPDSLRKGYVSASTGIYYNKINFSLQNNTNLTIENDNMSGEKIIYTPEDLKTKTWYNSSTSGYKTLGIPEPENYNLEGTRKAEAGTLTGIKDNKISGYAIPLRIDFSDFADSETVYTSCGIKLKNNLYGKTFTIALKPKWNTTVTDHSGYKFFLQLGTYANDDGITINEKNIPTWDITDKLFSEETEWKQITVNLSDEERAFFTGYHDARIVVIKEPDVSADKIQGTLLIGPYETGLLDSLSRITWNSKENVEISDYFQKESYAFFNKICINFRINELEEVQNLQDTITFTLSDSVNTSMKLELSENLVSSLSKRNWHRLVVNKSNKSISLDGNEADPSDYNLYINDTVSPSKITLSVKGTTGGDMETGKVFYEDSDSVFKAQNYLRTSYTWNDRLNLELISQAGTATINGETSASANAYGMTSYAGKYIKTKVDAKIATGERVLESAGHEVSTATPVLGLFSFSDFYRFSPDTNVSNSAKNVSLDLKRIKVPVNLSVKDTQKSSLSYFTENSSAIFSFNTNYYSGSIESVFDQKVDTDSKSFKELFDKSEYFKNYGNSYENLFQFGNPNAKVRNISFATKNKIHLPKDRVSPEIDFTISGKYKNSDTNQFTDEEAFSLQFPFKVRKQNFNLAWEKSTQGNMDIVKGGSYIKDSEALFNKQDQLQDFYKSIIFADLFLPSYTNSYTGDYSVRWNRPMFNNEKDFLVPVSVSFKAGREYLISNSGEKDSYQFKLISNSQAFNLFGQESSRKIFDWYNTDEFTSSVETILKFPKTSPKNLTASLSLYGQALFYINNDSSLKTSGDLILSSGSEWETRLSTIFTSIGKQSILASLTELLIPDSSEKKTILRKESLNIDLGKNESGLFSRFDLSHNCEVTFEKYYSLYTTGELTYNHYDTRNDQIGVTLSLGIKISY
ncbi:MAG: DNA polymerase IV [Treponema sp.]|nr:DNA polymerase IV [Treponema sp.]